MLKSNAFKLFISICVAFVGFLKVAKAQTLTADDFRLCLDTFGCRSIRITRDQLLSAKRITPNFSWFKIKSFNIYIGEGNYTSEITTLSNSGDTLSEANIAFFKKYVFAKQLVTIVPDGYNTKGQKIDWPQLSIFIKE